MKKVRKYNYQKYTVLFDLDIPAEKELVDWLEENKGKRSGFSVLLKKALAEMVEKEEK